MVLELVYRQIHHCILVITSALIVLSRKLYTPPRTVPRHPYSLTLHFLVHNLNQNLYHLQTPKISMYFLVLDANMDNF